MSGVWRLASLRSPHSFNARDVRSEVDPAVLGCTTAERRLGPWLLALLLVGYRRGQEERNPALAPRAIVCL